MNQNKSVHYEKSSFFLIGLFDFHVCNVGMPQPIRTWIRLRNCHLNSSFLLLV